MLSKKLISIIAVSGLITTPILSACNNPATATITKTNTIEQFNHPKTLLNNQTNSITTVDQAVNVLEKYNNTANQVHPPVINPQTLKTLKPSNDHKIGTADVATLYIMAIQQGQTHHLYQTIKNQIVTNQKNTIFKVITKQNYDYVIRHLPMDVKQTAQFYSTHSSQAILNSQLKQESINEFKHAWNQH